VRRKATTLALCLILLLALPCAAFARRPQAAQSDRGLTVMTRNLYLGTDLSEIFAAQSQSELLFKVGGALADVQDSRPQARMEAIAGEIADARPDLVGLQEVALWQTGPFLDPAPATDTAYDFLQLLLDALEARGLRYAPVSVLTNFEAEAPALGAAGPFDLRYTQRDAVLARADLPASELKIERSAAQHFAVKLSFPNPFLGQITIPRGWVAVDAKKRGKTYRFVSTHLESFSPLVNYVQANELLHTAADTELPLVVAGDFNADALAGDATYQLLLSAGLQDAWAATHPNEAGATWSLFLADPFGYTTPTQRLDLVLYRGALSPLSAEVIGEENVTPASPMPSDHAGVAASFVLQP
jgi:endonuclease/exonuclease/phosphatase family metal-dependent hydrolase